MAVKARAVGALSGTSAWTRTVCAPFCSISGIRKTGDWHSWTIAIPASRISA
jgi:hypothetical protein